MIVLILKTILGYLIVSLICGVLFGILFKCVLNSYYGKEKK
jgi:hypothetical protein